MPPQSLGAYLRDLDALMAEHGLDGLPYGHFGDGCVHLRLDFPLRDRPARAAGVHCGRGPAGRRLRRVAVRRARRRPGPQRAAAADVLGRRPSELFGRVKQVFDPAQAAEPRRARRPGRSTPTCGSRRRRRCARGLGFAYPHDGGDFAAAVHRCTGVGKCLADTTGPAGSCARPTRPPGTRRTPPGAGPGSCRRWSTARWCAAGARPRSRGAGPVPVLQGLLGRMPGRRGHGHLQGRGAVPALPAPAAARVALRAGPAAALGRAGGAGAGGLANAALPGRARGRAAKRLGGIDARRDLPGFARRASAAGSRAPPGRSGAPAAGRQGRPAPRPAPETGRAGAAVRRHLHRLLRAAGRPGRGAGARGRRLPVQITDRRVCCGLTWISTGQLTAPAGSCAAPWPSSARPSQAGIPIVGLEPSCTAVLRSDAAELLPDDPRAAELAGAVKTLAELLAGTGLDAAGPATSRGVAQPHCHHTRSWAGTRTRRCCARRGRDDRRGRRLLRPGRQLRRGARPLRRVGRGRRDRAAARRPQPRRSAGRATVLADGFSCRTQLDQLADTPAPTWPSCWPPASARAGSRDGDS